MKSLRPSPLLKGGTNIMRLRVLPKRCSGFWSGSWCFYEAGIGKYEADPKEGLNLGGVGFTCFPLNAATGGGTFSHEVHQICEAFSKENPDWDFTSTASFIMLLRKFKLREKKQFPVDHAAQLWSTLVMKTLPAFDEMIAVQRG